MTVETKISSVLLVEDDDQTRERLAGVVRSRPELELLAAASTFAEGRDALGRLRPDVLLTDLGLPDGDGTDLIRLALQNDYAVLCMVITVFGDERHVVAAIEAGALGYLLKDATADQLADSILEMVKGGSPISSAIARQLLRRLRAPASASGSEAERVVEDEESKPQLTTREQEVLRYVVKGFNYREIAELIGISTHTVTTHVRGIYRKLAVKSRGEAVYEALQLGLVRLDE